MLGFIRLHITFAGCGRWGIQRYFAWIKNPKPIKEKKKEKLLRPNGHAPAVTGGRRDTGRQFSFYFDGFLIQLNLGKAQKSLIIYVKGLIQAKVANYIPVTIAFHIQTKVANYIPITIVFHIPTKVTKNIPVTIAFHIQAKVVNYIPDTIAFHIQSKFANYIPDTIAIHIQSKFANYISGTIAFHLQVKVQNQIRLLSNFACK
ncbi:MAG TPA: hypothetical protein PLO52_03400 [Flavobacterium alvei]|nr:hypothetical protein [Flavobacterium alvei]